MKLVLSIITALLVAVPAMGQAADKEQLGKALEYFQSAKYHECLLILSRLDREYTLNPRFRAFLGVCCYNEGEYREAIGYLSAVIGDLEAFSPQERSVYWWSLAESLFLTERYKEAIAPYERALSLCQPGERPDALYRLGFCYLYLKDLSNADDCFTSALAYYKRYRSADQQPRIAQTENMIKGIKRRLATKESTQLSTK